VLIPINCPPPEFALMRHSCGLLMYSHAGGALTVFLAHPGGPYWRRRNEGAWTIPKGEPLPGEDLLVAAQREFSEETGLKPSGPFVPLAAISQKGGKIVHCWAFESKAATAPPLVSNTFEIEWPPRSGRVQSFPEIDRAGFFPIDEALRLILPGQAGFIRELAELR
jgi:predicted NUDIX family NTP pyrophosphohydrolase